MLLKGVLRTLGCEKEPSSLSYPHFLTVVYAGQRVLFPRAEHTVASLKRPRGWRIRVMLRRSNYSVLAGRSLLQMRCGCRQEYSRHWESTEYGVLGTGNNEWPILHKRIASTPYFSSPQFQSGVLGSTSQHFPSIVLCHRGRQS